jgi:isopenicillin N synthase-like dioxygenase
VLHGPNIWPDQVPGFSTALRAYISACLTLGDQLLRGIALGLGLPEGFFAGQLAGPEGSYWVARVIHYPPLQQVDRQQEGASATEHCAYP